MRSKEFLEKAYRKQRRQYEAMEEELFHKRKQSLDVLVDVEDTSRYYMNQFIEDGTEYLEAGLFKLDKMKDEVQEASAEQYHQIQQAMDDLDREYLREAKETQNES